MRRRIFRCAQERSSRQRGFTLIELLVVIAIIAILAAVIFPVFVVVRRAARNVVCTSNLRQQGIALHRYLDDYDETYPPIVFNWSGTPSTEYGEQTNPQSYPAVFQAYVPHAIFHCPNDVGTDTPYDVAMHTPPQENQYERWGTSYRPAAELGNLGLTRSDIKDTTTCFWASDASGSWGTAYWRPALGQMVDNTGADNDMEKWRSNTVFIDGHVRNARFLADVWYPYEDVIRSFWPANEQLGH